MSVCVCADRLSGEKILGPPRCVTTGGLYREVLGYKGRHYYRPKSKNGFLILDSFYYVGVII